MNCLKNPQFEGYCNLKVDIMIINPFFGWLPWLTRTIKITQISSDDTPWYPLSMIKISWLQLLQITSYWLCNLMRNCFLQKLMVKFHHSSKLSKFIFISGCRFKCALQRQSDQYNSYGISYDKVQVKNQPLFQLSYMNAFN